MATSEERRTEQIGATAARLDWPEHPGARITARDCLDGLLAYFDESEPEMADLIRNGRDRESTGVHDREGQVIRVGDIVETWADLSSSYVRVVVRLDDQPVIEFKPLTGFILCERNTRDFQVLGNIYDNRDLIPESFYRES